jgi:RNA polymerase sigma-70 factor (ECF subfamily)
VFGKTPSRYINQSDVDLLKRYGSNGDLEILGVLYQRYMHLVYGVCLKYLKEPEASKDAVMQIFEKLVEKIPEQEITHFKSWLYVVTRNHCLMSLRQQQKRKNTEAIFMESSAILHLNGESEEYHAKLITKAITALSEEQQHCIKLFYFQSLSYQQIADETGYELKKVKSYIQNGKRNLKIYLDQNG